MSTPTEELHLYWGAGAAAVNADWNEMRRDSDDGERFTYWETFTYRPNGEREVTLLAEGPFGYPTYVRYGDQWWALNEFETYEAHFADEDGNLPDDAFTETDFQTLSEISPEQWGSEGPMMNYYTPLDPISTFTPEQAAWAIRDFPLCIVAVDGENYGLALTGGGMDLSWEIAGAFIALGYYPPAHIDRLPRMAGMQPTADRVRIVQALMQRDRHQIGILERNITDLADLLYKLHADQETTS